jgi:hypothetical protein
VEQRDLLRDDRDRRAQGVLLDVGHVLAVDEDAAALGIVEPLDQGGERRLARARRADDADLLPGRDRSEKSRNTAWPSG